MSVTSRPLVMTGAPVGSGDLPIAAPLPAPKIHLRRTRTAGWQLAYVSAAGHPNVLERRLSLAQAILHGAAAARVHGVPLEVDQ